MSFNLETFYRESLGVEYPAASELDLTGVARTADPGGIRALVQLLVGAAVSCGGKADYIQAIMQVKEGEGWRETESGLASAQGCEGGCGRRGEGVRAAERGGERWGERERKRERRGLHIWGDFEEKQAVSRFFRRDALPP